MEIRFATTEDTKDILDFIEQHWNAEHIFVKCPQLFEECHQEKNGVLNYVIAKDENKVFGICGFLYANHSEHPDIWLALWKVIPSKYPGLGLAIVKFLKKETMCRILCCNGIKKEVKRLYEFMGFATGRLRHYYRLADKSVYTIPQIRDKKIIALTPSTEYRLNEVHSKVEFLDLAGEECFHKMKPYKDKDYIIKKYFENIAYTYKIWGCSSDIHVTMWVFAREIHVNGMKILRIVDILGDRNQLAFIGCEIQKIMDKEQYEYIDFYQYGISDEIMLQMGFVERMEDDTNVIPNYFEPFISENIELYFFTNTLENFYVFKGDGDQERTNVIPLNLQKENEK